MTWQSNLVTHGQPYFDAIVSQTGCGSAGDKLECLRQVAYSQLEAAINASPGIFAYQVHLRIAISYSSNACFVVARIGMATSHWWYFYHWLSSGSCVSRKGGKYTHGQWQVLFSLWHNHLTNVFGIGDCDDEGTFFSLSTLNITSVEPKKTQLRIWLKSSL